MRIYNAASLPIVVRTFAAGIITEPDKLVMIHSGEFADVFGPHLPQYDPGAPYLLIGDALVRDWGQYKIIPPDDAKIPEMVLRPKARGMYKKAFAFDSRQFEGFMACFYDEIQLIGL